jgi:hypothetical protein
MHTRRCLYPRTLERFFEIGRVDTSGDGCWVWCDGRTGLPAKKYGWADGKRPAHRVAWELAHGVSIGEGLVIRHTCDHPPCVRPDHLLEGTVADNARDAVERGRLKWSPERREQQGAVQRVRWDSPDFGQKIVMTMRANGSTERLSELMKERRRDPVFVEKMLAGRHSVEMTEVVCLWCGVTFMRRAAALRYMAKKGSAGPFCSQSCASSSRR